MATFPGWAPLTGLCDPLAKNVFDGTSASRCDIGALLQLAKNGMQDLFLISTLLMVAALVVAGIKLLSSGSNSSALTEAKEKFGKIFTGYIVIFAAWVIVYTIADTLLDPAFNYFLKK